MYDVCPCPYSHWHPSLYFIDMIALYVNNKVIDNKKFHIYIYRHTCVINIFFYKKQIVIKERNITKIQEQLTQNPSQDLQNKQKQRPEGHYKNQQDPGIRRQSPCRKQMGGPN